MAGIGSSSRWSSTHGHQAGEGRGSGLADVHAGLGVGPDGPPAGVVVHGHEGVERGRDGGQRQHRRQPAVQSRHQRPVRAGYLDDVPGPDRGRHAGGGVGLDADEQRAGARFEPRPQRRAGRRAQGPDPQRDDGHVDRHRVGDLDAVVGHHDLVGRAAGRVDAAPFEGGVDLGEDRGVPLDDPAGRALVARPGRVGDDQVTLAGHLGRERDRVVVGARRDDHLGALGGDAVDAGVGRAVGHEDRGGQAQQFGHPGHGAAVVAVGGRHQAQRTEPVGDDRRQVVQRRPRRLLTQPVAQHAVGRPRGPQDLERG